MSELICRLLNTGRCDYDRIELNGDELPIDLQNLIREDKKYGYLTPDSSGYITYRVYDGDREMPLEAVSDLVRMALTQYQLKFQVKFRRAKRTEKAMLNISFSDPQTDKYMTGSTLAYHGYPGGALRGICRINRNYYYTSHGLRLSLHVIDPEHYPDPAKAKNAPTWDLDQILLHEFGHGVFGLQHDGRAGMVMSPYYGQMSELLDPRTSARVEAKGFKPRPKREQWKEERLQKWLMAKMEPQPIWVEQ